MFRKNLRRFRLSPDGYRRNERGGYEQPGFSYTLPASSALVVPSGSNRGNQFRFVDCDSSGNANLPSAGGRVVGVCQNKPLTGQATTIVQTGIVMVEASAAITQGADLMSDATGQVVAQTSTNIKVGVALEAASGAGIIIAVLLKG
jgi:hypothetical protein